MVMLKVVIGIIFVLLLLSLLATTIMELVSSLFRLRGRNLERALRNMLQDRNGDDMVMKLFQENSMYKQLSSGKDKQRPPSYMGANTFQSILFDVLLDGNEQNMDSLRHRIQNLGNEELRNVLNQLMQETNGQLDDFRWKTREWYDNVMDRASGWYKRKTQRILVFVGLAIGIGFNADTLELYQRLERDPATLEQVVSMAEQYVEYNEGRDFNIQDKEFDHAYADLQAIVRNEIESIKSPLGLGWQNADLSALSTPEGLLLKIAGFIVTALAISLGAPFWFDLLRKIVNIRQSGSKPGG